MGAEKTNIAYIAITTFFLVSLLLVAVTPIDPISVATLRSSSESSEVVTFPKFVDQTLRAGILSPHLQNSGELAGLHESIGPGVCSFDYDNDSLLDLFIVGGSGEQHYYGKPQWWSSSKGNRLYKNLGGNKFKDVTDSTGLQITGFWGMGCLSADLDNDGDQDLIITAVGENRLYKNNQGVDFSDVTESSGITGKVWSTSVSVADYNKDGLLDFYINNYIDYKAGLPTYEASAGYLGVDDAHFEASKYESVPNSLYQNKGNLVFEEVNSDVTKNYGGRSLSSKWFDINSDSYPDLLVVNDKGSSNKLFLNMQGKFFIDKSDDYNLSSTLTTRSISIGDIQNDNIPKLIYSTNSTSSTVVLSDVNDENYYSDVSRKLGLDQTLFLGHSSWGGGVGDFNNDGWVDLYFANGLVTRDTDASRKSQGQTNSLLINNFGRGFVSCTKQCMPKVYPFLPSRAAVFPDLDNDGDLDVYVSQNNSLGQLLINELNVSNWIGVELVGTSDNRDGIGAVIELETNNGKLTRYIDSQATFLSTGDKRAHFGLGLESDVKSVTVNWPNGSVDSVNTPPKNTYIKIVQGMGSYEILQRKKINKKSKNSKVIFHNPEFKLSAVNWLISNNLEVQAMLELDILLDHPDETIRKKSTELASSLPPADALSVLSKAVVDTSKHVRSSAIEGFQTIEEEISFRWIAQGLRDDETSVRCKTAEAFGFFFEEEEAMPVSKFLVLSDLIQMLNDDNPENIICVVRALGKSEKYRPLKPLLKKLNSRHLKVKQEVVSSLGDLKEAAAIAPITDVFLNKFQPSLVRAEALSSLRKFQEVDVEQLLAMGLSTSTGNEYSITSILKTYMLLFQVSEYGLAIDLEALRKKILIWSELEENKAILTQDHISLLKNILGLDKQKEKGHYSFSKNDGKILSLAEEKKVLQSKKWLELLNNKELDLALRIEVLEDRELSKLKSFRTLVRNISSRNNDPLSYHALSTDILASSGSEREQYRKELKNPAISEERRFLIAKVLIKLEPRFVLSAILSKASHKGTNH